LVPNQTAENEVVIPDAARFMASLAIKGFAPLTLAKRANAQQERVALSNVPKNTDHVQPAKTQEKKEPITMKPSIKTASAQERSEIRAPRPAIMNRATLLRSLSIMTFTHNG